jgi:uncharacterized protein YndB with AHSA1/START domain
MGITIGLLNVRRSILINALPQRVWCEFEAFDRIGAWFGQGPRATPVRAQARRPG